ncbi:hypothetical protein MVEG_10906 [Podila verticillata NRRL 6337]|nr:hypothetical protein MVEG_10906 [Podila verticillata NRRL 6337]
MIEKINKAPDTQLLEAAFPNNLLQLFISLCGLVDEPDQPALCLISPVSHGYIQLMELELMRTILRECTQEVKSTLGINFRVNANDLYVNLGQLAPGVFLSRLMVPLNSGEWGYCSHLQVSPLGQEPELSFKHYALTGTFRTNGLVLKVLAYDLCIVKQHDPGAAPGQINPQTGPG